MTDSEEQSKRVAIFATHIGVALIVKAVLRHHGFNVIYAKDFKKKSDIEDHIKDICILNPDWVFLANFVIDVADDIASQIKIQLPNMIVAGISTYKVRYQIDTSPQFLDYVHYYPLATPHLEEAIQHLSRF